MNYPAGRIGGKDGNDYPIFVDDNGHFLADVAGKHLYKGTRDELRQEIEKLTKRAVAKVDVPFTKVTKAPDWQGGAMHIVQGKATGIHGANDNILATFVRRGSEMKEQITDGNTRAYDGVYFKPLAAEEAASLRQIWANKLAADKAYREFLKEYGLDLRDAVLAALDNAQE
jgi:hypothetical protein